MVPNAITLPTFSFDMTTLGTTTFDAFKNKWLILYIYPKDATPGCTQEGIDFRDNKPLFDSLNAIIIGMSRDSLRSHNTFKEKQALNFDLISDPNEILCQYFDVMREKNMYGKKVRGIERSTFLFNPAGHCVFEWRKVTVKNHVDDVIRQLKTFSN